MSGARLEPPVTSPTVSQQAAALATGSVALLMLGLQPLLLGAMADEKRLDLDGIGYAATMELLLLGLTTGLLAAFARPGNLRAVNIAGALGLALADAGGMFAHGIGLVASRAAAGIASGTLVWIAVCIITRAARPDRLSGIFLTVQTMAQAMLAALLPPTLMPSFGANGGLATLAALAVAATAASLWLPSALATLPKPNTGSTRPPLIGLLGLASIFFVMAGVVGLWVFIQQLGSGGGISPRIVGIAVAAALAAQVAGSSTATLLAGRLPVMPVLIAASLLDIAVIRALGGPIGSVTYLGGVVLFGFLWLFVMPFQVRLLVEVDPSRRTAMLLSATQLLGSAAGPLITAAYATGTSLHGALLADAALFAAGTILACVLVLWRRAAPVPGVV